MVALKERRVEHTPVSVRVRVEDHDDIIRLFEEQTSLQYNSQLAQRPFFLSELIEAQNQLKQTAVCEVS